MTAYGSSAALNIRTLAFNATFALMLCSAMFLSCRIFVEAEIISKWYAFIGGSILLGFVSPILIRETKIAIDPVTVSICIFIAYLSARIFFSQSPQPDIFTLSIAAFILTYLFFKLTPGRHLHNSDIIIAGVCLAQAVYGLMQYTGITYANRGFSIAGSFDNPAGFAACISAGLPLCFSVMHKGKQLRYFGLISAGIIVLAVILSESRAGILTVIIVTAVYLGHQYYNSLKKYRNYIIPLLGIAFITLAAGLFLIKKDSAFGRMLIWENTCRMIADKQLFGFGPSGFMSEYMVYQAGYFTENPDSPYALLADNVTHPFNEYLLLTAEYGFVGLLLLLVTTAVIIKSSKQTTIPLLCLLSAGIFGCFSYPLRYPFVWILIAYSLGMVSREAIGPHYVKIRSNPLVRCGFIFITAVSAVLLIRGIKFESRWGSLANSIGLEKSPELLNDYSALYAKWNGNPLFLYNYGAVLNHAGNYKKSNAVMAECEKSFNDYDVQMVIGDNYSNTEEWYKAESRYIVAGHMIPNRFIPLFKLMKVYQSTNNTRRLSITADTILQKKIKIPSPTVDQIIKQAKSVRCNDCD